MTTTTSTISNLNFLSRLSRSIRVTDYRNSRIRESEDLGFYETTSNMSETIPRKSSYLHPPLSLSEDVVEKPKTTDLIEFILKQRAGSTATAPSYKIKVARFCEGTVAEWIEFRKAIAELWRQNGLTNPQDRVANICTILRGDSLTGFEEKIQELTTSADEAGGITDVLLTDETVLASLNAVALTIFPFNSLETQKQWMRRRMKKPKDLSIRKYVSTVGRLNNSLPLFPNGRDADKFTAGEILEILAWSIPEVWRTKFDKRGYVPAEHGKERFVTECEAVERNEPKVSNRNPNSRLSEKTVTHKKSQGVKHRNGTTQRNDTATKYYCTEHGQNTTHPTDKCFTLKNRADKAKGTSSSSLSKSQLRKELHILTRGRPKKQALDMFAAALKDERAEYAKYASKSPFKSPKKAKKAKKAKQVIFEPDESSDSSDCDMSVQHIEKGPSENQTDETDEDQTYQDRIKNLGTIRNDN